MYAQAASSFNTARDLLRFAVSRFNDAGLFYGHGTQNAYDEAAYLILSALKLPVDQLEPFLDAKLLPTEVKDVIDLIERRAEERVPVAYLTHEAWQGDFNFYVDERVLVPRSFIYELLGEPLQPWIEHRSWCSARWTCAPVPAAWPSSWRTITRTRKSTRWTSRWTRWKSRPSMCRTTAWTSACS